MGKRKSSTGGAAAAGAGAGAAKRKKASGKAPPGAAKDGAGEDWTLEWHADGASACLTCDVDQETSFMGSAEMMVTRGVMRVMGREVGPSSRWVHLSADPRCGGALPLEAVAPTALGADGEGRGVRAHGSVSAEFRSPPGGCEASFRAQRVGPLGAPPPERMFRVPPEWQEAAAAVTGALNPPPSLGGGPPPPVVVVVCGSKGVGKSTLCQVVCNTLLNACPAVAFLDTDLGQPEFTVPGQVSLHVLEGPQPVAGPAHTHPRAPARAHFVGDTSPASHPELYLEAVAALHRWYRSALGSPRAGWMPLVVNTHGWIKGAGLDLLVDLLRLLAPSHVLQVNAPQGAKNLPEGAFWTEGGGGNALGEGEPAQPPPPGCSLLHVKSVGAGEAEAGAGGGGGAGEGEGSKQLSAVDTRALNWLSFAVQCCRTAPPPGGTGDQAAEAGGGGAGIPVRGPGEAGSAAAAFTQVAEALAAQPPFAAPWGHLEVVPLHESVPAHELARAVNGAVVGLGVGGGGGGGGEGGEEPPLCVGVGVVRSVDTKRGVVHLLTPLPLEALQGVRTLLLGHLQLPPQLLAGAAAASPYLSRNSLAADLGGAGAVRSRNNLLRHSQV